MARAGRRPGNPATADRILEAARREFASSSYEAATIRRIAAQAGVDPALVLHYFGSKRGLFEAALGPPFDVDEVLERIIAPGPAGLAERMVGALLETWDDPATRDALLATMRTTVSLPDVAHQLGTFMAARMVAPVVDTAGTGHHERRAGYIVSQLVGLIFARYIIGLPALQAASHSEIVGALAPTIDRYLTMPLEPEQEAPS
jgi:AcrR family transcriptional regulator